MDGIAPLLIALGLVAAGPGGTSVRVPIDGAGEVDVAEVVARLAARAGVAVERPPAALRLPIKGLAGALTRTLLTDTLGPDVSLAVRAGELILDLDPEALEPGRRPRLARRIAALAARARDEARGRLAYGMKARGSYRPNDPGRPTVCLIHGINSTADSFTHMFQPLEEAGFGVVVYEFPYNQDLDVTAPAFGRDWTDFRKKAGETRPWAIVAHSMGGLVARHYVEGPDYGGDVSDLVLIAPPNRGSAVAKLQGLLQLIEGVQAINGRQRGALAQLSDGLGAAADDMAPGGAFLKALNARPRRQGVRYHILAGDSGFLTAEARARVEAQYRLASRASGVLGGLARLAVGDLPAQLDALTDGTGDGAVTVAATRLDGVADHVTIHANHVELIRGPLLYPDPGPVACMPYLRKWLGAKGGPAGH
jgi:pimeloyl-ACP methyl ester carboxylesterase